MKGGLRPEGTSGEDAIDGGAHGVRRALVKAVYTSGGDHQHASGARAPEDVDVEDVGIDLLHDVEDEDSASLLLYLIANEAR